MKARVIGETIRRVCCAHHLPRMESDTGKRCAQHTLRVGVLALLWGVTIAGPVLGDTLKVDLRKRVPSPATPDKFHIVGETQQWSPSETAIVICDMWNQHWCKGATERVAELAPVMNQVVSAARDKGVLIVHSPSGTIDHYKDHPARLVAKNAPKAANLPEGITSWCQWKDETEKKAGYPIDHSDGGCDCQPQCKQGSPWTSQIATIEIKDQDAISDSGAEVWNLLEARGIKNVILMGVHANMCVLGRPFGLRNLAKAGKNVVLMRDLTDTMYNFRQPPRVNHFTGTDLIVEHTEKYVCPSIVSTVFTGKPPFRFKDDKRSFVVFLSAENEYDAAETLPAFAHELQLQHGLRCEIVQGATDTKSKDLHYLSGMEILAQADLAVVFARRRALPTDQMKCLHDYLDRGGPLIGLRTACHAFDTKGTAPKQGYEEWTKFDPEVLGGNYHNHYAAGPKLAVTPVLGATSHPILKDVELPLLSNGSLYKTSPLAASTMLLLVGTIPDQQPEPVAWTNRYKNSRVFFTSLGSPDDFANPQFRKLLVNAVVWAMDKK